MDANASIQPSAVASAYSQPAVQKSASKASEPPPSKAVKSEDRLELSQTAKLGEQDQPKPSLKNITDRLELSKSSQDMHAVLAPAKGAKKPPEPVPPDEASQWSQERLAKLDRLALLVKEGHYNIQPFMVDEIALRLARAMASI